MKSVEPHRSSRIPDSPALREIPLRKAPTPRPNRFDQVVPVRLDKNSLDSEPFVHAHILHTAAARAPIAPQLLLIKLYALANVMAPSSYG